MTDFATALPLPPGKAQAVARPSAARLRGKRGWCGGLKAVWLDASIFADLYTGCAGLSERSHGASCRLGAANYVRRS